MAFFFGSWASVSVHKLDTESVTLPIPRLPSGSWHVEELEERSGGLDVQDFDVVDIVLFSTPDAAKLLQHLVLEPVQDVEVLVPLVQLPHPTDLPTHPRP